MYNIGIIGGGTAGLTAAIYGQRAGKQTVVFEGANYGGQIVFSPNVENYPGIASISGAQYSMNLVEQATNLGAETKREQVKKVKKVEDGYSVVTEEGEYLCQALVLATGVTHRHLGLENEEKLTGAGVSYCATCDGMFFRGKNVAVIGGGNTALQDAEFLSNYCSKVYLVHRREEFRGDAKNVSSLREKENVEFVLNALPEEILGEQMVQGLVVTDKISGAKKTLDVDGIFVAIGHLPKNEIFAELVDLDAGGFIKAGENCETSRDGIFAAGDCRTKEVRQLTTAAADGAVAALAAVKYIK
jgi:thioredoxin reductase (NADPH)